MTSYLAERPSENRVCCARLSGRIRCLIALHAKPAPLLCPPGTLYSLYVRASSSALLRHVYLPKQIRRGRTCPAVTADPNGGAEALSHRDLQF